MFLEEQYGLGTATGVFPLSTCWIGRSSAQQISIASSQPGEVDRPR